RTAATQVGTTTDIITGTVTGPDNQPLAGALVQATSLATQGSRQRSSNASGRLAIVFPGASAQYTLTVPDVGMAPRRAAMPRPAFSVAGQRPTANRITLDGLAFGGAMVPQDAIRSARVVTNTYDVARGQFSGGLIASITRSGTNVPQGAFTYNVRDRALAWGGVTASPFSQGYTQNQIGGGMGGPVVRARLFVCGALQGRWKDQALPSLATADAATLERLGVSPDSAARFLALEGASGVPV